MMKLGILGAGMIVREFLPWLTGPESPFKVEALCSTERSAEEAQALCGQYGVARHTTRYDELLSWVDVVYIAVPNIDRKSTRLNSSHPLSSRMPSSA